MNRFYLRILVCVIPTLLSIGVVAWAVNKYNNGEGGFRLGVDLAGGTILVYQVDETKTPEGFKPEDLAAALKRRIDPADLYNITIRPVPGNPPRVEIILPTGGKHQAAIEQEKWEKLLGLAWQRYPGNPYYNVKEGDKAGLIEAIAKLHPDKKKEITTWVDKHAVAKADWSKVLADAQKQFPGKLSANPYLTVKRSGDTGGPIALTDAIVKANPGISPADVSEWIETQSPSRGSDRRLLTSEEVEKIKALIEQQGRLEFRILADRRDDRGAIEAAEEWFKTPEARKELAQANFRNEPPPGPKKDGSPWFQVDLPEEPNHTYSWVELGKSELYSLGLNSDALNANPAMKRTVDDALAKGEPFIFGSGENLLYVRRITNPVRRSPADLRLGKQLEFFALTRDPLKGQEITGDYLVTAYPTTSQRGERAIAFRFNAEGGNLFYEVTSKNKPSGQVDSPAAFYRHLAIVFDKQILSAPVLRSAIRTNGEITGKFSQEETDFLVRVLRAGALPATLKKDPVSQNSMGATLGADTIRKGTWSVLFAFLAVLAFMIFYYRAAGLVACVALLANLLMTVAFMVLVQAAFTLPGLAGLVLMLGMAVDANVLIYERLREERDRGASLAMALRNGYDRAFPTIVDTHLSSIFTAIVLYVVGNDQLKGFGISLTVGLIISLFTSLYMTRTIFEIWLFKGWLKKLTFFNGLVRLIHAKYWDFMAIRYYWFTGTIILTLAGAALFIYRLDSNPQSGKSSVLNIDFIGGTAYTAQLAKPMNLEELRAKLENDVPLDKRLPDLSIEQIFVGAGVGGDEAQRAEGDKSKFFTVRTSDKNAKKVFAYVQQYLGDDLKRILMSYKITKPGMEAVLTFTNQNGDKDFASPAQVQLLLHEVASRQEFAKDELARASFAIEKPTDPDKSQDDHYSELTVKANEALSASAAKAETLFKTLLEDVKEEYAKAPQPERLENFDRQLAANTQERALYAILASWAAILLYLWFRFGSWTFGAATVLCLIHDLFFTLGGIAVCHYLYEWFPGLASALLIQDFKIDLPSVAALLTLVGYSVNDTIVVFDRIREVRGKNPALTPQIINDSVNQTLTRTILASTTVWLVVIVLYIWGGEGVHLFAFVMVIGVVVGTYSSIYIASPLLLIFGEGKTATHLERAPQTAITKG
jgi:SecD/SecF fusion protein